MVQRWQLRSLHPKALGTMCHTLLKYSKDPLLQVADWGDLGAVKQDLAHLLRLPHPREITDRVLRAMLVNCMREHLHGREPAIKPNGTHQLTFRFEYGRMFVEAWFEYHDRTLRFSHWSRHERNTSDSQERAACNNARNRHSNSRDNRRSADIRCRRPDMRSSSDEPGRKRERSHPSPMRTMEQQRAPSPSTESAGSQPLTRESPHTVAAVFPEEPQSSSPCTMAKHRLLKFIRTVVASTINNHHDKPQSLHDSDGDAEERELIDLTEDIIQEESPKRRRLEDAPAQRAPPAMLHTPLQEQRARLLPAVGSGSTDRESSSSDNLPAEPPQPTLLLRNERHRHADAEDSYVSAELRRERHALVLRICDKLRELQVHRRNLPLVIDLTVD